MRRPLLNKLGRDLLRQRAQASAIAGLLALGVALLVTAIGTRAALERARDDYYLQQGLADLQLMLVRAPHAMAARAAALPGVQAVEARLAVPALLVLPNVDGALSARLYSLDDPERVHVNRPWRVDGRWPEPNARREVALNEAFAQAQGLGIGDELALTIRGSRERLRIVGIANSPEFVFVSPPGELLPQPERHAVLWMPRRALEQAAGLEGAFNELLLRLGDGVSAEAVAAQLEPLFARYGAGRAQDRSRIPSARLLDDELRQLGTMARILPPAFLAVAAFLLNLNLTRLVEAERSTLGLMKAFGLRPREVVGGYLGFALVVSLVGVLLGLALGRALGELMCGLYLEFYRLPALQYRLQPGLVAAAFAVGIGAAFAGSSLALRRVLALRPSEALAPPSPPSFRHGSGPLKALAARFDPLTRVALRRVLGFPRRSLITVAGFCAALILLVLSMQAPLAIERLLDISFGAAKRQQITLSLAENAGADAFRAMSRLPGVERAEPFLALDAVFSAGARSVNEPLLGLLASPQLERLVDAQGQPRLLRDDGLLLSGSLARQLGVRAGDAVEVQLTGGLRRRFELSVAEVVEVTIGSGAWLEIDTLARYAGQPGRISGAHLRLRAHQRPAFDAAVRATPMIAASSDVEAAWGAMRRMFEQGSGTMTTLFTGFAVLMAVGIAYATSTVVLGEQRRDLATLCVLGYGRREASYVLLAELALLCLIALPLGLVLGHYAAQAFLRAMATDVFQFPSLFEPRLHLRAGLILLVSVIATALWVRRGVDRIGLVESLKVRE
ncbi:MAG: ABC transporter permease [Lysobacterales bacterium]